MIISCESLFIFSPEFTVFPQPIPGLTTVIGRSFLGLVAPRAVWAGVPKTYLKKSLLGLNATLAVGPRVCDFRPEGECFAPFLIKK